MASIKRLKKDVDYLAFAVIADCFNYNSYNPGNEEVFEIVKDTIALRNELRYRISNPEPKEDGELKAIYKCIFNEAIAAADDSFIKLSEAIKKNM
ncbi:MAG: hypothetical protein WBG43_05445 [Marinifilaceae bacterium]|jgi:hypothetical protein